MRKQIAVALSLAVLTSSSVALAGLPRSAVTNMSFAVHGIYLTADPLCQTGLVATVPLSKTATTVNFASTPTLGSGAIPSTIACVVILFEDSLALSWAAGTYTSTSGGGNDNVCNAGGVLSPTQKICRGQAVSYPAQITADATAAGVTLATACPSSPVGTEIIPLYLSTSSACSGAASDPAGCNSNNSFAAPTVTADTANGIKLTAPAAADSAYTFVANPDLVAVGNNSGACGSIGPPLFSFRGN